jgi:hypothetical protein
MKKSVKLALTFIATNSVLATVAYGQYSPPSLNGFRAPRFEPVIWQPLPSEYLTGDDQNAESGAIRARILGMRRLANGKTMVTVGFVSKPFANVDRVMLFSPSSERSDYATMCRREAVFADASGNEHQTNRCFPAAGRLESPDLTGGYEIAGGAPSVHTFDFTTPPSTPGVDGAGYSLTITVAYHVCSGRYNCQTQRATLAFYR